MNTALMLWGLLFSSIGFGYFIYGRKQSHRIALYSGIALMVYPYFVQNSAIMVVAGVLLMLTPKYIKI